jgi:peptidoglycan hydrolase-like protein with peptidoglycan-binding domain
LILVLATAAMTLAPVGAAEPAPELLPVNGFSPLVALDRGATGAPVIRLQYALKRAGFYRGPVDGVYGTTTATAVITFEKYLGLRRQGDFGALDWIRLALLPDPDLPYRWDEPDRVEIDLTRQLLYVVRDQTVVGILPTSTGSGSTYYSVRNGRYVGASTPEGDFDLRWHQYGWNCDSVTDWCVYNYWSFTPFYGIHGYREVPAYPASHGCSRVHLWDSDWLEGQLFVGMPVHVWRQVPVVAGPPLDAKPPIAKWMPN